MSKRQVMHSPLAKTPRRANAPSVNVFIRLRRPKSEPTITKNRYQPVVTTFPPDGSVQKSYAFTDVFTEEVDQAKVFAVVAKPLLDTLIGTHKNGLIFTYGITGAGKTHTMEGPKGDGLVYRTFDYLFNSVGSQQTPRGMITVDTNTNTYRLSADSSSYYPTLADEQITPSLVKWLENRAREQGSAPIDQSTHYCVFMSIVEFYMKELRDLLNQDKKERLEIRADSYVARASQIEVKSADEAARLYLEATKRRKTLKTSLNDASSRGHLVVTLRLARVKNYHGKYDKNTLGVSQMCLVDLAGSERTKLSGVSGSGMQETCSINNSLSNLRKCVMALKENKPGLIPFREDNLTMLFKSYFEGNGAVSMVLCVRPEPENFKENLFAMEFGTQTRNVKVDYASPPKQLKRSRSKLQFDPDVSCHEFLQNLISHTKEVLAKRRDDFKILKAAQNEVRGSIVKLGDDNEALRQEVKTQSSQLKTREDLIVGLEEQLTSKDKQNENLLHVNERNKRKIRELNAHLLESRECKDRLQRIQKGLSVIDVVPSAPMHCSSPIPGPSTECTESNSDPLTNSSSNTIEYHRQQTPTSHRHHSPSKQMSVPSKVASNGVPVVDPKHNRSLSCSNLQWIHHKPPGTVDTGTVLRPKLKNGRSVKTLRSSDILRRDAGGYSVVHQDADTNGDVETKVYKGHIISTVCGGAQVILDDIETMKHSSPKGRRRTASDVHYNY